MVEFLRLDRDLLHAATAASGPLGGSDLDRAAVRKWVQGLGQGEKDDLISRLIVEPDMTSVQELHLRFRKEHVSAPVQDAVERRSVATLLRMAKADTAERRRAEVAAAAREKAAREQEAAIAREAHLDQRVGQESRLWAEAEALAASRQPKKYHQAVQILVDFRDMGFRSKL